MKVNKYGPVSKDSNIPIRLQFALDIISRDTHNVISFEGAFECADALIYLHNKQFEEMEELLLKSSSQMGIGNETLKEYDVMHTKFRES